MQRIIFSPCLLYSNEDFYDWHILFDTLDFIEKYLDCGLDTYEGSFFHCDSWYSNPQCDISMMNYFSQSIFPSLLSLSEKGDQYKLDHIIPLEQVNLDPDFKITHKYEFELLLTYLYTHNRDCMIFVGTENFGYKEIDFNIFFTKDRVNITLPIIKNPWLEESENFNHCIKEEIKDYKEIFPCKPLCERMLQIDIKVGDKSNFKKYAGIVALRNGYYRLPYSSSQYKNVPYYRRNDQEYTICVDTLHGFFETFQKTGSTYDKYTGEYDFSCNEVSGKTSSSENHICYK